MPDIPMRPDPTSDFICGRCIYFKLRLPEDKKYEWTGTWVCKSEDFNPGKKDPEDGKKMFYNREKCEFWRW